MPPDSILTCLHCSPQNFFLACIVTLLMLMMLLLLLLLLLGRAASIGRSLRLPMLRGLSVCLLVTTASFAKTAESRFRLGLWTLEDQ